MSFAVQANIDHIVIFNAEITLQLFRQRFPPMCLLIETFITSLGTKIQSNIIQDEAFLVSHFSRFMEPVVGLHPHWKLCYRASSYGWSASTFHSYCDGKRDTVTIIKKGQYVFGGYTDIPWGMTYLIHAEMNL